MTYDVIVIGGGASGFLAAIEAARRGLHTAIIEKKKEPLKKLLVTGNGRCNFTNKKYDSSCYRSQNGELINLFMETHNGEALISYFENIGLRTYEKDGYCYPYTNQAKTVADVLIETANSLGVDLICDRIVQSIIKEKKEFHLFTSYKEFFCTNVVLATGGMAGLSKNEMVESYDLAKSFQHSVTPIFPALSPITLGKPYEKKWKGVRQKAGVFIEIQRKKLFEDYGEIQFNEDTISGIPILQLSRFAAEALQRKDSPILHLNLLSPSNRKDWILENRTKVSGKLTLENYLRFQFVERFFEGMGFALQGLPLKKKLMELNEEEWSMVYDRLSDLTFPITNVGSFNKSQVTAGGVRIDEIDLSTMESKKCKGLYLTGEVLDVDGICGGYNLSFAFHSGIIAGKNIGKDRNTVG